MQLVLKSIGMFPVRWLLFYFLCFTFPFPLTLVMLPFQIVPHEHQPDWLKETSTYFGKGYQWINKRQNECIDKVAKDYLDVKVIIQPTGSGDTMRNYVGCLCAAVLAAGLALVWTVIVPLWQHWWKGARPDSWLHALVRLQLRYYLMQMLLGYGFAKVFPNQFPVPSYRLAQTFGDISPMGLLWAFMGFSPIYQMFTGGVEVLAGLLFISRRTSTLGGLVTVIAMTQIFALNMCFDVPVKLHSFHYLIMGLFMFAPDLPRLLKVLVLGQAVEARPVLPLLGSVWFDRVAMVFRLLILGMMLWSNIHGNYVRWNEVHGGPPAPVTGRWEAVSMKINDLEAEKNDPQNWKTIDFSFQGSVRLFGPTPPALSYKLAWNPDTTRFTLTKYSSPQWRAEFRYRLPEPDKLELRGEFNGKKIVATYKKLPDKEHLLMSRGFHWIQEMPFN